MACKIALIWAFDPIFRLLSRWFVCIWPNCGVSLRYGQHYATTHDKPYGVTHFSTICHLYMPMYIRMYMLYMLILSSALVLVNVRQIPLFILYGTYTHCIYAISEGSLQLMPILVWHCWVLSWSACCLPTLNSQQDPQHCISQRLLKIWEREKWLHAWASQQSLITWLSARTPTTLEQKYIALVNESQVIYQGNEDNQVQICKPACGFSAQEKILLPHGSAGT